MSIKQGLSSNFKFEHKNKEDIKIGVVVSEWNKTITEKLLRSSLNTLVSCGIPKDNILVKWVPGSFEIPLASQWLAEYYKTDCIISIGCIIKGKTPHYKYLSHAVTTQIASLSLKYNQPFIMCVLTTLNEKQALERTEGKKNKGIECALSALKMICLKDELLVKTDHHHTAKKF